MVSWRDTGNNAKKDVADFPSDAVTAPIQSTPAAAPPAQPPAPAPKAVAKESVISADLSIEGKIEGAGHVRIAGKFKGDVDVQGDLTIEVGAKVNGGVRARKVTIAGELEGNVEQAQHVELLASGAMTGDLKAGTVTFANGSRMRGQVDFGFEDAPRGGKSRNGNAEPAGTA